MELWVVAYFCVTSAKTKDSRLLRQKTERSFSIIYFQAFFMLFCCLLTFSIQN